MNTRLLPREEWSKLADTEVGALWANLPDMARVVVVELNGQIVGCHVLLPIWHLEGLWVAPAHRGRASVARQLWTRVKHEVRALGISQVCTAACDDRVRGLLAHVEAKPLPEHFMVRV